MLRATSVCSPKCICFPPNLDNPAALDSQGVLVDLDHQAVLQDLLGTGGDGAEIRGHEEWSCHHCPQSHLGARLLVAKAKVSNDELEGRRQKDGRGRKRLETCLLVSLGEPASCWEGTLKGNLTPSFASPLVHHCPHSQGRSHPCWQHTFKYAH